MRHLLFIALILICCSQSVRAEDARLSALQKQLIGHWVSDRNAKIHSYYSPTRRMLENDIPNSDAAFVMMDFRVWDEWPELRTIILTVNENAQAPTMLLITFSEDGKTALYREKSPTAWSRTIRIRRVDDKTHPAKLPEKLKLLDADSGNGQD